VSSYYYRGKRYTKKQSKAWKTIKKVARRVEHATQGLHPPGGGGRDPEYYVAQIQKEREREAERDAQTQQEEKISNDPDTKWMS
jgi:hypothetical protein